MSKNLSPGLFWDGRFLTWWLLATLALNSEEFEADRLWASMMRNEVQWATGCYFFFQSLWNNCKCKQAHSVQFSCSVVSDSLQLHELQHVRPPCPSPTPRDHSNSCPSSQWCHPAIPSSVVPFSSCPESLPASKSFPMSQLFAWGGKSTGVSALASFLPQNTQVWFLWEWLVGSPCSPRDSQDSSPTPQFKSINSSALSLLHSPTLTSIHERLLENRSFD